MDLKHKGITWVGNMYQKFEAVCHEVDNIISQDTVKYVENHVNSASESVKKLYSDVVQDFVPPNADPKTYEAQAAPQRKNVANSVANRSSAGLRANDLMDNQPTQESYKTASVNGEGAQVSNHSHQELNADLHLRKTGDVLRDKKLDKSINEKAMNEPLSRKSDGRLMDEHVFVEPDLNDPLKNLLKSVSSKINSANKRSALVCDDSDMQLEDEALPGKNDGILTDKDSNESSKKDASIELDASDPLKNKPKNVSSRMEITNEDAIFLFDDSRLPLDSGILPKENDDALTDEGSYESFKKDVIMEPDASDPLKNHSSHSCNEANFVIQKAPMVSDDSHLFSESHVLSFTDDSALTDRDLDKFSVKDGILECGSSSCLSNLPIHACRTTECENEDVVSASNNSILTSGKIGEALIDEEADASLNRQAKLKISTELISCCDKESVKHPLYGELCHNERGKDIVTLTGDLPATSIHKINILSTHRVRQASSILVDNLENVFLKMETSFDSFADETNNASNAPDAAVSLEPPGFTCGEVVEEMRYGFETRSPFDVVNSSSCENKALETRLAFPKSSLLPPQSLAEDVPLKALESGFLPELCASSHDRFSKSTGPEALVVSSELGCSYNSNDSLLDADMETVDLRDNATHKDSCDILDYRALHSVSRRTQRLRSYKKRIQDVFTSKKRLAKEYEQLAIWYGDTGLDSSTGNPQRLPLAAETSLNSKISPPSYSSDSEWELL